MKSVDMCRAQNFGKPATHSNTNYIRQNQRNIHMQVYDLECRLRWQSIHQFERSHRLRRACQTETHPSGILGLDWRLLQTYPERVECFHQWQSCHPLYPEYMALPRGDRRAHESQESIPLPGCFAEWSWSLEHLKHVCKARIWMVNY